MRASLWSPWPLRWTWSVALAEAQYYGADAQSSFTDALTDFASGNLSSGLIDLSDTSIDALSYAPDAIILGLIDSMPGIVVGL